MNKADLVDRIAAATGISKTQATAAIGDLCRLCVRGPQKGRAGYPGRVCRDLSLSQHRARNGRNPQTGALMKIAARRVAKFTPGEELRKAVNRK